MVRLNQIKMRDIHLPDYSIRREGITQGLIMCYMKCRREFLLRINEWGPIEEKKSFANGAITHDTLDKIYTYYQRTGNKPTFVMLKNWIDNYDKENPNWLGKKDSADIPFLKSVCYVVVTEYLRFYAADFIKFEIVGAENIFDLIWKGFRLRGKKDLRFKMDGRKWIMETKTMARIDEAELVDKIAFDFQSSFYTLAEEVEYKEPVIGVIYNVVRNPGFKVGKDENLFQMTNRLRREIRKDPKHFFYRWHIPFTTVDKMEFKQELYWKLLEIDKYLNGELKTYKNEKNCVTRFRCVFLRGCASGKLVGYSKSYPMFKELLTEEV